MRHTARYAIAQPIGRHTGVGASFQNLIAKIDSIERPGQNLVVCCLLPVIGLAVPAV